MTAQIGEKLIYQGQQHTMCSEPLGQYLRLAEYSYEFVSPMTALWRGYVGTWEIIEKRLYLTNIHGSHEDGTEVSLETIFPDYHDKVYAHWYSGTLRIPQGRQLEYVHMGYGSKYERDLLIEINRGMIVNTNIKENGKVGNKSVPKGYGVGAFTVFGRNKEG